ncbi:MAG: hypothetical protein P4K93_03140 [Terracidiphilus sp.]|nr:hypothetical protein [Terracidiphilus sp.]MDR3797119.1 hypothetical protein [Terracidiphilus sp.]
MPNNRLGVTTCRGQTQVQSRIREGEAHTADRGLAIRDDQFSTLQAEGGAGYIRSLVQFLRDEVPGTAEEDEKYLLDFVKAMVEKAKGYGLKTKRDAAVYVISAYMLGRDFEEDLQVAKRVLSSSLPGPDKAKWLQDATVSLIDSRGRPPQ